MQFLSGFAGLEGVSALVQDLGLDLQEVGLDSCGAADAPQQGCQPEREFALDRRSGVEIRDDGCFECSVVLKIFEGDNDGFCRQSMSDCILPRALFAVFGFWAGAPQRIASIRLDLSQRSHSLAIPHGLLEAELPAAAPESRLLQA
jgi:hypothetical protein